MDITHLCLSTEILPIICMSKNSSSAVWRSIFFSLMQFYICAPKHMKTQTAAQRVKKHEAALRSLLPLSFLVNYLRPDEAFSIR